jgi:rRNA small subunit methyltransferase G
MDKTVVKTLLQIQEYLGRSDLIDKLRSRVQNDGFYSNINYEQNALVFNQAFFLKNFLKCYYYLEHLNSIRKLDVKNCADIGAGAGVFSIALKCFCPHLRSTLYDNSINQIFIAREILMLLKLDRNWSSDCSDVYTSEIPISTTRLFSYFACEEAFVNQPKVPGFPCLVGKMAYVIDYPDILTVKIDETKAQGGSYSEFVNFKRDVPGDLCEYLGENSITISGVTLHDGTRHRSEPAGELRPCMANT